MKDEIREQLSALLDDELSDAERPLLLGRLERDVQLRDCLGRYQLISEVLHGSGQASTLGLAARVQRALEHEAPPRAAPAAAGIGGWWKAIGGLAVAASVTAVAVMSLHPAGSKPESLASSGGTPVTANAPAPQAQWKRIDKRLAGYLVNHSEYAASRGVQGVMPYVRVVGYDSGR